LKHVLLNEVPKMENVKVEFISGKIPTAHLYDIDGNELENFAIGDINLEQFTELFLDHGLTVVRLAQKPEPILSSKPSNIIEIENITYELFPPRNHYHEALAFAQSLTKNGEKGRLLTFNCSFQEIKIKRWLNANHLYSVWLGASDSQKEGQWLWTDGPLKNRIIHSETSEISRKSKQYSNWAEGEPNNADQLGENCAVLLPMSSGWNDVTCQLMTASIVVEFGSSDVECPKGEQPDPNDYYGEDEL